MISLGTIWLRTGTMPHVMVEGESGILATGNDLAANGYDAALAGIPYLSTGAGYAIELELAR